MITTNTGAKKLESSDNWREIFPNSTLGTAGAHNASVDAADRIQPEIAPIINGKQCALGAAKDDYVLLRNSTITGKSDGAYIAAKAIPANTDIDSTYLGNAITGGISNSINSKITQLALVETTVGVQTDTNSLCNTSIDYKKNIISVMPKLNGTGLVVAGWYVSAAGKLMVQLRNTDGSMASSGIQLELIIRSIGSI